jgi:hypothetical protein
MIVGFKTANVIGDREDDLVERCSARAEKVQIGERLAGIASIVARVSIVSGRKQPHSGGRSIGSDLRIA